MMLMLGQRGIVPTIATHPGSKSGLQRFQPLSSPFICLLLTGFSTMVPPKAPPSLTAPKARIDLLQINKNGAGWEERIIVEHTKSSRRLIRTHLQP